MSKDSVGLAGSLESFASIPVRIEARRSNSARPHHRLSFAEIRSEDLERLIGALQN
jgi:hypothetical protein